MNPAENHRTFDGRNRVLAVTVGLSPIWVALLTYFFAPRGFGGGLYQPSEAAALAALGAKMVYVALVGLLTLAGTVTLWRARSGTVIVGAVLLLTLPALVLLIFGPAFVLIFQNLRG